eukprot:1157224-Pelagomonas_calceolata.AAC.18
MHAREMRQQNQIWWADTTVLQLTTAFWSGLQCCVRQSIRKPLHSNLILKPTAAGWSAMRVEASGSCCASAYRVVLQALAHLLAI